MSGITDQNLLDAANATAEVKFQEIFENDDATPGIADRISETIPTDAETGSVDFLGAMPVLRKWVGKKEFQPQRAYEHTYALEPYEASFELPRMKVRYDRLGVVGRRIEQFFRRNRYWKEKILFDELVLNSTGYDGVAFFSASHPHGPSGGVQSNTTASAFGVSSLDTALQAGGSLRDENGENIGISYDLLVTGPKLRKKAMETTGSTRLVPVDSSGNFDTASSVVAAGAVPNFFVGGMLDYLLWPRLVGAYDDYWLLFDTTNGAPALLLYEGRAVEQIPQTEMTSERRFMNDKMAWSLESDHDPIVGAWQSAYAGIL